jgi:hypothetical protein
LIAVADVPAAFAGAEEGRMQEPTAPEWWEAGRMKSPCGRRRAASTMGQCLVLSRVLWQVQERKGRLEG